MSLEATLKRIEKKLENIEIEIKQLRQHIFENYTTRTQLLVALPDHLRRTAEGLMRIGHGTANDVSKHTGRARAVESGYLNQLERQGFVQSFRKSRRKFFSIESKLRIKQEFSEISS